MQNLAPLKLYLIEHLPALSADKCHLLIVNGTQNEGYLDYTARLLFLDYRADPLEVLAKVKQWLRLQHRHLNANKDEIQLSFSSEIIDTNTFDLEIDFPQREKIIINDEGYHLCPEQIWSDYHGQFIAVGSEKWTELQDLATG